jgi:membrane fusion protein, heavy metal efflux system
MKLRAIPLIFVSAVLGGCGSAPHAMVNNVQKAMPQVNVVTAKSPSAADSDIITLDNAQLKEINIATATVEMRKLDETVEVGGQIETDPNLTTPVISLMPGRIEQCYAQLGDRVVVGQPLCDIRSDEVAQIEADTLRDVLELEADIERVKVEVDLFKRVYERKKKLLAEGIAATAEVEAAKSDLDKSQAEGISLQAKRTAIITSASERLRLFGVPVNDIKRVLKNKIIDNTFTLNSPRHGIVTSRSADVGQLIDNVHDLFVVSDLSRVWLMAQVYEKNISQIRLGDPVDVTIDSYPGRVFKGKLDYIASTIETDTRTMAVRVTVQNPSEILKPKMFARVNVRTGTKNVLAIPDEAVQKIGEVYIAYVQTAPGRFREAKIEVGDDLGHLQEIKSGLSPGETVVTHGSLQLQGQMLQRMSQ